ncbi:MAG: hypothetical protein A2149_04505 [Candidatus Schekmanbacteria bacterium RBG_16_38_11]|uniref:Enoyl-CoA hydratase n=1 Tax=Candidatus Schekmanbacteria bacterium RBG_16_38_11 TaxID=1817880 RepID=A0A1F7S2Q7_9BACT|nr:MAG: hypothetical protein A2149_04505 [Candidatus Schekmanbacteria bacterium RBG_16_38_11]
MKEYRYLKVNVDDKIAVITIDNPPVNALSKGVILNLEKSLQELNSSNEVRAIVITGAGNFFVAGADIREIDKLKSKKDAREMVSYFHRLGLWIESLPKPVIAAINGPCLGGGLELAMICHLRIASANAKIGLPEIKLGIIPGFGGTQRLPRIVGKAKALEMLLTGDPISAQEAKENGLVNLVSEPQDLLKQTKDLAARIINKSLVPISKIIKAVEEGFDKPIEDALEFETALFCEICETSDKEEGVKAFLEKRQPEFQDK